MLQKILIVGALPGDPARASLLTALAARNQSLQWDWLWADCESATPPRNQAQRMLEMLRRVKESEAIVIKLRALDGKTAHDLFALKKVKNIPAPAAIETIDELIEWIFSPAANIVPRSEWFVNDLEAALLSILSKLARKKYWNKDVNGHE